MPGLPSTCFSTQLVCLAQTSSPGVLATPATNIQRQHWAFAHNQQQPRQLSSHLLVRHHRAVPPALQRRHLQQGPPPVPAAQRCRCWLASCSSTTRAPCTASCCRLSGACTPHAKVQAWVAAHSRGRGRGGGWAIRKVGTAFKERGGSTAGSSSQQGMLSAQGRSRHMLLHPSRTLDTYAAGCLDSWDSCQFCK